MTSISAEQAYKVLKSGTAPADLTVSGVLDYSQKSERRLPPTFPDGLSVDVLDLSGQESVTLPSRLTCYELNLSRTSITTLPSDLQVTSRLDLTGCELLENLPSDFTVGTLLLRSCTSLTKLPENLDVWFLDLTGCWAFETWPESAQIRSGRLQLRGCTALRTLPPYLHRLAHLNIRDCPNLTSLPANLSVSGWVDLGHSGLTDETLLPQGLQGTQLRWAGINVDRRIAFHPEQIHVAEVLGERNAERRRVMLDRYGYGRFLQDSHAEILDRDVDPGGQRQLMRVKLEGDEDLVAMSCFCPSTGRQYMIRVPPVTPTCRAAAAWIAGFDDPDDYQPILET
ncbi:MAG: hypothetical protein V4719_04615 [Planctomycetota bacterium]